jgi:quercetin dioxygenase-like cupin family protein
MMGIQHIPSSAMPEDRSAIEGDGFTSTVARFDVPPGPPGGWHHHGDHDVIAYLIAGKVRIEWGVDGRKALEPAPGDLVRIEPGTIHRERYEGRVEIVGFTVGSGPGRVDVEGPERGASARRETGWNHGSRS